MSICSNHTTRIMLVFALLLLLLSAAPVLLLGQSDPSDLRFVINDSSLMSVPAEIKDGCSMVPVQHFAQVTGAGYDSLRSETATLTKENKSLTLSAGSLSLVSQADILPMPVAPYLKDGQLYVPLRFLCQQFGIAVLWNNETRVIALTLEDTRQGMTPQELLAKAEAVSADRYSYKVTSRSASKIFQTDGTVLSDFLMDGQEWVRRSPYASYLDQTTKDNQTGLVTEHQFIVTDKQIFTKTGDAPWLASASNVNQLLEPPDETSAALAAEDTATLSENRPVCLFGDDTVYEGRDCFVIKQYFSPAIFQQNLQAFLPYLDNATTDQDLEALFSGLTILQFQTLYIDKMTFRQAGSQIFEAISLHVPGQAAPYARFHTQTALSYADAEFYAPANCPGL